MSKLMFKGMWAHKRRLFSTFLAVFLGVAFLAGTQVLGSTLEKNFNGLFADANAGTDALVRRTSELGVDPGEDASQRGVLPVGLVDEIAADPDVAVAAPYVEGHGELVGADGERLGGNGPPTLAGSWIDDPDLNPYDVVEGRAPESGNEVVINRGAAEDGDLHVGDTTTVLTPAPVEVEIVGIATFNGEDGLGGVTFTAFTLEAAQEHILGTTDSVTSIRIRAADGVSPDELVSSVEDVLPEGTQAISGADLTDENTTAINDEFLGFLRTFLTIFAVVALLVATFSIYNTFSILVAQRTRESALLRAVGAGRGQILGSIVVEALLVGVLASAAGVLGGLGIAGLLKGLFDSFGFALPAGGLAIESSTVVLSVVVGLLVTLVAGIMPAIRASRVAPLAAIRDVAVDRSSSSALRAVLGLVLTGLGIAVVSVAVAGSGDTALPLAGLGALMTMVGVVVFGPVVAKPAARIVGAPLAKLRGVPGSLARQNAMRSPKRTSATASALMIGVGVVTLFTVFAASIKASIDESVSQSFSGDLVIQAGEFGSGGVSPELAPAIGELPEIEQSVGLGSGRARLGDDTTSVKVADPSGLAAVLDLDMVGGEIGDLGTGEVAVSENMADDQSWEVGDVVPVTFSDGTTEQLTVAAVYEPSEIVGNAVLSRETWAPHAVQDLDSSVLMTLASGVGLEDGKAAVQQVADEFGGFDVLDRQEYIDEQAGQIDMMLGLIYVMLALAIIIALMGIANTLSLSVHERTRELGLLRAVGESRSQLRSMIRWESVIIAVFGTIGGLGLGVFLGWALVQAVSGGTGDGPVTTTFAAPVGQLVIVLVVGAIAGVLAGIRPARRAARLDVLDAIAVQ